MNRIILIGCTALIWRRNIKLDGPYNLVILVRETGSATCNSICVQPRPAEKPSIASWPTRKLGTYPFPYSAFPSHFPFYFHHLEQGSSSIDVRRRGDEDKAILGTCDYVWPSCSTSRINAAALVNDARCRTGMKYAN